MSALAADTGNTERDIRHRPANASVIGTRVKRRPGPRACARLSPRLVRGLTPGLPGSSSKSDKSRGCALGPGGGRASPLSRELNSASSRSSSCTCRAARERSRRRNAALDGWRAVVKMYRAVRGSRIQLLEQSNRLVRSRTWNILVCSSRYGGLGISNVGGHVAPYWQSVGPA